MSIRNKLLFFFILIVLLPTSIILLAVYDRSINIISRSINASLASDMNMIETNIMQKFEVINDISTYIYMNPEVVQILSDDRPDDYQRSDLMEEMATLDKVMENYMVSGISGTSILPKIYLLNRPEYMMFNFSDKVSDLSMVEKEKWYRGLPASVRYTVVGVDKNSKSDSFDTIKIAKRLFGLKHPDIPFRAVLTVDIYVSDFVDIIDKVSPLRNSSIYIVDEEFTVMVSSKSDLMSRDLYEEEKLKTDIKNRNYSYISFVEKQNNIDMMVACKKIEGLDWSIIATCPLDEMYGELIEFKKIVFIVLASCILLTVFLAFFLSENLSYPIRKLVHSMSSVDDINFEILIEYNRKDEFSYLIQAYKDMLNKIKGLIGRLYISESNKRKAELNALQAQINPHFLYNTLDSINWLALKLDAADISTMVTSLSDFFRYSLNKGKNIISLNDEKKQVESYLTIQKIRFRDKLDYHISFPPEILQYLTVKLILQPLVENAIIHGIEKKKGIGFIKISAEKVENDIEICVSDNGAGADTDEINKMLEESIDISGSFGIRNVNERIKQTFGDRYGIKFYPHEPYGVVARVLIPAVRTLEGYDVKNDNSR